MQSVNIGYSIPSEERRFRENCKGRLTLSNVAIPLRYSWCEWWCILYEITRNCSNVHIAGGIFFTASTWCKPSSAEWRDVLTTCHCCVYSHRSAVLHIRRMLTFLFLFAYRLSWSPNHTEPQKSLNMKLKTSSLESPWLGPWSWENLENSWRMRCVSPGKAVQGPFFLADFHAYTCTVWPRMTIIGVVTDVERSVFLGLIHASILRVQGPASLYGLSCLR